MKPVVVKIYDKECEVCISMHSAEKAAREEYGTEFLSLDLEFAAMHQKIFEYVSSSVADNHGDLQLPCYLFVDERDNITGHFTGAGTHHDICGNPVPKDLL